MFFRNLWKLAQEVLQSRSVATKRIVRRHKPASERHAVVNHRVQRRFSSSSLETMMLGLSPPAGHLGFQLTNDSTKLRSSMEVDSSTILLKCRGLLSIKVPFPPEVQY